MNSPMKSLNRLMARQNFKDEKEFEAFINALNAGQMIPDIEDLTDEEKAQDLVEEAYDLSPAKAKKNIDKALKLDPDCIEAYEFLAGCETVPDKSIEMYDKGIAIGRKLFGGKFLKENKGYFWGMHETRPFMRCLYQKAFIFLMMGKTEESIAILIEMLDLNEGDNQGVRYLLLSELATIGDEKNFKKYDKIFAEEESTQLLYPRALFAFKTEGDTAGARKKMIKAFKANPYVLQFLMDDKLQFSNATSYAQGTPEEAEIYLIHGMFSWYSNKEAFAWMVETLNDFCKEEMEKETPKAKKVKLPKQ